MLVSATNDPQGRECAEANPEIRTAPLVFSADQKTSSMIVISLTDTRKYREHQCRETQSPSDKQEHQNVLCNGSGRVIRRHPYHDAEGDGNVRKFHEEVS
jgi:hypothetical protein